jgi:ABC-type uncharacterized transport system permease subunit
LAAAAVEGYWLYRLIDLGPAQNLAAVNMVACVLWLMVCFSLLLSAGRRLPGLTGLLYPWVALSIVLCWLWPGWAVVNTKADGRMLWHILSAVVVLAVMGLALLQGCLLYGQNWLLRRHASHQLLRWVVSVEAMEQLLFQLLWVGFILLTGLLLGSFLSYYPLSTPWVVSKFCFSLLAWLVFAILLIGRYRYGWRGKRAWHWLLGGVVLLLLLYIGSLFIFRMTW